MGNCFASQSNDSNDNDLRRNQDSKPSTCSSPKEAPPGMPIGLKSKIIVPLYIYPHPGAWQDLHQSIQDHPDAHFTVIINPYNGPGPDALPDANYLEEVPKLTSYTNVDVLGYVHVSYMKRPLVEVTRDVETYAGWTERQSEHPGLAVHGIFVDEIPFSLDAEGEKYLSDLSRFTKNSSGLGPDRTIIHNPGCVPARVSSLALADLTIIFEDAYGVLKERLASGVLDIHRVFAASEDTDSLPHLLDRSRIGLMIHSVPPSVTDEDMRQTLSRARALAGSIFITESSIQFYERFSARWRHWVELIGASKDSYVVWSERGYSLKIHTT